MTLTEKKADGKKDDLNFLYDCAWAYVHESEEWNEEKLKIAYESLFKKLALIDSHEKKEAEERRRLAETSVKMRRVWAMPSKATFTIGPIAQLIWNYVGEGKGWADPFAGNNSPAEFTNDLDPRTVAKSHIEANEFATILPNGLSGVIHDPPYSLRQLKECYDNIGASLSLNQTKTFPWRIKEILAPKVRPGGIAICCGWNSGGFGAGKGFQLVEVLLVCHGRSHNDTIVTVERKMNEDIAELTQSSPDDGASER